MDEQFSQEYIAFMQKAEGLQALWVPEVGDRCVDTRWSMVPDLVRSRLDVASVQQEGIVWLPSLFQLIRVIEGAGWEWRRLAGQFMGWPRNSTIQEPIGFDDKDLMLGFAQLAVRAVEGKE